MNPRERKMIIVVGALLVLFAGRGIYKFYTAKLAAYAKETVNLNRQINTINLERAEAEQAKLEWIERLGPQTLSVDVNRTMTLLRDDLYTLSDKASLSDVNLDLGRPSPVGKHGVRVLNCSIAGTGKQEQLTEFMLQLHRAPYQVRIKHLVIARARRTSPSRKPETAEERAALRATIQLETLILPGNPMVKPEWIMLAELEEGKRKAVPRTSVATLDGYKKMLDKKMFQPYEPPPPVVVKPPPATQPATQPVAPPVQVALPPPPPPRDAEFILARLLSSPRGQMVVLQDNRQQNIPDEYKEVGDEVYGGTLIYVHPLGAVTEKEGQRRFHTIGKPLKEAQPLTAQEQPMVYDELLKLEKRAEGIKDQPG